MMAKNRMYCFIAAGCLLAGVILSGCRNEVAPPAAGPAEVAVVTVATERIVLNTELPGRINPYLVAGITPQVSGLLQKRLFQEGALVREGDILYQIDPTPYQVALDQATAALALSESEIALAEANMPAIRSRAERLKELAAIRAVGAQDADDAQAALRQAEANLAVRRTAVAVNRAAVESARINLSYTPIKAPISGRIGKSNITVGAMVTAYQPTPLAVVQQLDPIYVDVTQASAELIRLRQRLEEGDLKRSRSGMSRVRLLLEDGTPYEKTGSLKFRDVTVDPTTGSVTLRLVFPNPEQLLLPGMFVRAVVEEGVRENAMLIPQQSVNRDNKGNPFALVVDAGGKVEQRALELDRALGDRWLVTDGLQPGDRVIVEGMQNVRPGVEVRAVPFVPAPRQSPTAAR